MDKEIPIEERRKAKRRNIIKISLIAGGCIAAIAIAVTMIRPSVSSKDITLSTAERGTIEASVSATGKVAPAFEEIITSPVASRILEVYCHEGDSVDIGTPLLSLDLRSTETELGKLSDERRMKANEVEQTSLNTRTYLDNLEMQIKVKEMAVNRLAAEGDSTRFRFARPHIPGLDYSFSGLKTSFLYTLRDALRHDPDFVEHNRADLAASLQATIVAILIDKLAKAIDATGVGAVAIGGGVSANSGVRDAVEQLCREKNVEAFIPPRKFTTDNAAMVAMAGYFKYMQGDFCRYDSVPYARVQV